MNVTYHCNHCEQDVRTSVESDAAAVVCPACQTAVKMPEAAVTNGKLARCLVCPSHDLFLRKDFPQRLGVAIVVLGFVASSVAWYYREVVLTFAILFVTALVDVVLYLLMGDALVCYSCGAEYRDVEPGQQHGAFNLETHERYRQQRARLEHAASSAPDDASPT